MLPPDLILLNIPEGTQSFKLQFIAKNEPGQARLRLTNFSIYESSLARAVDFAPERVPFTRLSSTKYRVSISATEPFVLSFAQKYDPSWVAYDQDGNVVARSQPLFSMVNGFAINATGCYDLFIVYGPQKSFLIGVCISITAMLLLAGFAASRYVGSRGRAPQLPIDEGHPLTQTIEELFLSDRISYHEAERYLLKSYTRKEAHRILKEWRLQKSPRLGDYISRQD